MSRSLSFYGLDLFDHKRPICAYAVGLMSASNDMASCTRMWFAVGKARRVKPSKRPEVIESDQIWVIRMAILHLWEAGTLLANQELRDELLGADLPGLERTRQSLVGRIEAHPLLRLRSNVSAHYKAKPTREALRLLRVNRDPWMEHFADVSVGHAAFKTPSATFAARAATSC